MDIERNINIYRKMDIVNYYSNNNLFEPEREILNIIKDELHKTKVLDIGVGAGRTTPYFSKETKLYVGIDYSSEMIERCKEIYGNHANITFNVCDARKLNDINDEYFNLVLFSYNGLDYMNIEDRAKSLQEISRVLKKGGKFIFSTHNLKSIPLMYKLYSGINPKLYCKRLIKVIKLIYYNRLPIKHNNLDYFSFKDSAHKFNLTTIYISLSFQIDILNSLGFKSVRAFSLNKGTEINLNDLEYYDEPWIYFYCLKK